MLRDYHDDEWGRPVAGEAALFERLSLEGAQAGLSWITILRKRPAYRKAFDGFNPHKIARYRPDKIERLLQNEGIVRNRLKIEGAVRNARAFLLIQEEVGSFDRYLWQFVDGRPRQHTRESLNDVPARTPESDAMSRDLKKRGFTFVGSTIGAAATTVMVSWISAGTSSTSTSAVKPASIRIPSRTTRLKPLKSNVTT